MAFQGVPAGVQYGVTGANTANNMVNISITFSVPKTLAVGTYPITLTDVGTGVTRSATFNMVVTAATAVKK
jgi:hypothetical protein